MLANLACCFGIISVIFYSLHDMIGGANYKGYNWMSQAVSDLTSLDAPSFYIANKYLTIYKISNLISCALLCIINSEKNRILKLGIYLFALMNGISFIGYTLFPLNSAGYDGSIQSFIHAYIITGSVALLSIVSIFLIAGGSLKDKDIVFGLLSILSLILMFVGAFGVAKFSKQYFGLFERFSIYSTVVFTGIIGIKSFLSEKLKNKYE